MARIACAVAIFIVYGSLYPFDFHPREAVAGPVPYLLETWKVWDSRGDLLSNILLYVPLGFFGTLALSSRGPKVLGAAILAILAATALSVSMELAQYYDAGRVTSMGDVYANAIGSAIGAIAAICLGAGVEWPLVGQLTAKPDASLLLAMFLGYRLYPYVPTIDMHKYWHAVQEVIWQPLPQLQDLLRFALTWLFIAAVIDALYGFRRWLLLFPLFVAGELAGRILIVDAYVQSADVLGAVIGFLVWAVPLRRLPGRNIIVAALVIGLIVALRLEPFTFSAIPLHEFGWIPFWSMMNGSVTVGILAFCEKFYRYGGMIWLLERTGMPLTAATGLSVALLFGTSYGETYLPGRSGEISDAAMALLIGGAFLLLRKAALPDNISGR